MKINLNLSWCTEYFRNSYWMVGSIYKFLNSTNTLLPSRHLDDTYQQQENQNKIGVVYSVLAQTDEQQQKENIPLYEVNVDFWEVLTKSIWRLTGYNLIATKTICRIWCLDENMQKYKIKMGLTHAQKFKQNWKKRMGFFKILDMFQHLGNPPTD